MTQPAKETETPSEPVPTGHIELTRRRRRKVPAAVWAISALWVALLLGASLVWPVGDGLDEITHVDMSYRYSAHPFRFYAPGTLGISSAVVGFEQTIPGIPPRVPLASTPPLPRDKRLSFDRLGNQSAAPGGAPDQMVQHPPLYYWFEAALLRVPGVSGLAADLQVWLMRLVSVAFMAPVPLLCWGAARRLMGLMGGSRDPDRIATLAAVVPLTIPDLIRDGSSVDNDALLVLTTSLVIYLSVRVMTGDRSRLNGALLGASLAAALLTKGFALALPLAVAVSYLIAWTRRPNPGRALVPSAVFAAAGALVGGLWWLRNLLDYGALQPSGFPRQFLIQNVYGKPDYQGTLVRFVPNFLDQFASRIWAEVGVPDTPSPGPLITWGWFFVVLAGVVAALLIAGERGDRRKLATLMLVPVAYFAIAADGSWNTFREWSHVGVRAAQGRYIYGGVAAIAVAAAVGLYRSTRPAVNAALTPLVLAGAVATNAAVWLLILRSWYQPASNQGLVSGLHPGFSALLRWSPVPEPVTVTFVIVVPVLTALLAAGSVLASLGSDSFDAPRTWARLPRSYQRRHRASREGALAVPAESTEQ